MNKPEAVTKTKTRKSTENLGFIGGGLRVISLFNVLPQNQIIHFNSKQDGDEEDIEDEDEEQVDPKFSAYHQNNLKRLSIPPSLQNRLRQRQVSWGPPPIAQNNITRLPFKIDEKPNKIHATSRL